MKRIIIFACIFIILLLSIGIVLPKKLYVAERKTHIMADSLNRKDMPVLKFAKLRYNFGTFKKKATSSFVVKFKFQNVGNAPLVIYKVDVSCGCLSADYPRHPIMPNQKGIITVMVSEQDFAGAFNKTLFVRSNATEDIILLRIVGKIK